MSAEVFISYASKDRKRILDLVDRLESADVSVWIDQMSIEGATMWSEEIVSAIRNCKVLILAISGNSADSKNVVKELALASEGQKNILPVYLESAEIPGSMAYQLAGIQRVEFFEGDEEVGQQSVIRALAKLGVTVSEEASTAAAGAPNRTSHGASHAATKEVAKSEKAAWSKIAAVVGGVAVLAAGIFFLGGSSSETMKPLGQDGANATNSNEQNQPLAKPVMLDTNRVVVLPFKTIGGAQNSEDLGYGLVSTLTSKLQPLQNLVIIANESARKFKDTELSPKEIGQALQVGTIVTGEIQTSGDKVQVNIRVINANTEALGWGSTFSKNKSDYLDLQNEIATKLASELKGGLDADEAQQLAQKATENAEAQAEYQAGRREWNKRSKSGFDNAIKHYEKAIDLDPGYAQPYVGLADTFLMIPLYNFGKPDTLMPKVRIYAEKAIQINPDIAGAYTSLGMLMLQYEYNWTEAEKNFKKALQLNPNYAIGYHWFGVYLYLSGKADEAIPVLKKGTELNPESVIIKNGLALSYWHSGEKNKAVQLLDSVLENNPFFVPCLRTKYGYMLADLSDDSVNHLQKALKQQPNQPTINWTLFEILWARGNTEDAKDQLIELHAKYSDKLNKNKFAEIYFRMGKREYAYKYLEESIRAKEGNVLFTFITNSLKQYQSEPRFIDLMKSINHPLHTSK